MSKYFPTFKKFFVWLKTFSLKSFKLKKFFKVVFIIIIFLACFITIKDQIEYTFGLGYWADDSMSGDTEIDGTSYCVDNENVQGFLIEGTLVTYIPEPYNTDPSQYSDSMTSADDIVYQIREAEKDDKIKVILVQIDSTGGESTAAKEIADALKESTKHTVAFIREFGASAAYWAASGADVIFANNTSNVGGIGVTMSYLDYSDKNQQEGLIYQQISSGKFKDTGDPDKVLTTEEKELLQRDVDILHNLFVDEVATNRNLDKQKVAVLADGSTMMGQMALDNGLIDRIGDQYDVEDYLQEKLGEEVKICW